MKVLFLNRVYPPADGATGHLLKELAERLVERGLEVTVVTSAVREQPPRSADCESAVSQTGSLQARQTSTSFEKPFEATSKTNDGRNSETRNSEHGPSQSQIKNQKSKIENCVSPFTDSLASTKGGEGEGEAAPVQTLAFSLKPSALSVNVQRVCGLPFSRSSLVQRALSYLSLYPRLLWRALCLPKHDVVVTMTDPPMLLVLGLLYKWLRGGRLVHWAQDLYPELAIELGVLSGKSPIAKTCRAISSFALQRHERVIALGRCMQERILQRGVGEHRIRVIPNWAQGAQLENPKTDLCPISPRPPQGRGGEGGLPSEALAKEGEDAHCSSVPTQPQATPSDFRKRHGYEGKFLVMYSGNLGLAHCFESILAAAEQLQSTHPEIVFLFVGSGPRLPWVRGEAKRLSLANVHFLPPQPLVELSASLKAADIHLVSMRENLSGLVVPSKAYGIFAAGRPCFFIGPKTSEVARIITEHRCGEVFTPYDTLSLVQSLLDWSTDPSRRAQAGQQAESIARRFHFDAAAEAFQSVLQEVLETPTTIRTPVSLPHPAKA